MTQSPQSLTFETSANHRNMNPCGDPCFIVISLSNGRAQRRICLAPARLPNNEQQTERPDFV